MRIAALAALLVALACAPAQARPDRIWTALVLATKEVPPKAVPDGLKHLAPTMERIFGYNSFYILGEKRRDLSAGCQEWLVPSKELFLKVANLEQLSGSYRLRIELYKSDALWVTTTAQLARNDPLFIRGPQWGNGQLILVLEVR